MFSLRAFTSAMVAGTMTGAFAADEVPVAPPNLPAPAETKATATEPKLATHINPNEGKVLCVSLPRGGKLDKAEVDFQFGESQTVTAAVGKPLDEQWVLEKLAWSDDGEAVVVTIRNGDDRRELRAGGELVAQTGGRLAGKAEVQVRSSFYEVPMFAARRVRKEMDATPGKDRTAFQMLDRALDNGAPAQVLTPPQFEALAKFLGGCHEVDLVNAPCVTTKSGQRAVIEIIREFRYPTEWKNDPTMPKPMTPVAFETRNCGVTLEIEPTVKPGPLVTLGLQPRLVEFLGAADREKGTPFPRKNRATHLPARALNPLETPSTHGRPAHFVFSERTEKVQMDLLPGYGLLLTSLSETEDTAPFQKTAPKGRLIVLVKAEVAEGVNR